MIRYPGGKSRFKKQIMSALLPGQPLCEPFAGMAAIGLVWAANGIPVRLNDIDLGVVAFWRAVMQEPQELIRRIRLVIPSVAAWRESVQRLVDSPNLDVDTAVAKVIAHQMSYSGLGPKSGGPLGGEGQKSKYGIACRWNTEHLAKKILSASKLQLDITPYSYSKALSVPWKGQFYLDPPYYKQGGALYLHTFTEQDHKNLADLLRRENRHWVLSYDDCPEIRALYSWADIKAIEANYTLSGTKRAKKELLICAAN